MTVSRRSPTRRSRSLPSSTALRRVRSSSLCLRSSISASSRPSMARLRAASAVLRSSCLVCMDMFMLLNWLILSRTEVDESRCWFTRSWGMARRGPPAGVAGWLESDSIGLVVCRGLILLLSWSQWDDADACRWCFAGYANRGCWISSGRGHVGAVERIDKVFGGVYYHPTHKTVWWCPTRC